MFAKLLTVVLMVVIAAAAPAMAQKNRLTPEEERVNFLADLEEAKAGDANAQFRVAVDYYFGRGVEEADKIESAFWLQKSADQGHKQAINRLAWHYRNGVGVIQDVPRAEKLYKQAYNLGVVGAAIPLSAIYRSGEGRPVEEDGQGRVRENHSEAVRWALIAAEAGIDRGQNILGELYRDGIGVRQDFATALEWFEKAAQQDLALALYNASRIYRDPDLGFQDYPKGMEYLRAAADKGHAGAMIDLADAYINGTGVEQSYELALEWFSNAAAKNRRSAVKLAKAYEEGLFGGPDPARAYKWYYIAQKSGEASGIVGRLAMKEKITDNTRVHMENEGDEWLEEVRLSGR